MQKTPGATCPSRRNLECGDLSPLWSESRSERLETNLQFNGHLSFSLIISRRRPFVLSAATCRRCGLRVEAKGGDKSPVQRSFVIFIDHFETSALCFECCDLSPLWSESRSERL